jgi:hypothetical protein
MWEGYQRSILTAVLWQMQNLITEGKAALGTAPSTTPDLASWQQISAIVMLAMR